MKTRALEKYTVRDVLEYRGHPQLQHTVRESDTVEDALELMYAHDIVSLPVFGGSGQTDQAFVDIVSVYDLRDYITNSQGLKEEVDFQILSGRASGKPTVLDDTVAQVVKSRKHASREVSMRMPLEQLVQLFATYGQHRVLVTATDMDNDTHANDDNAQVPNGTRKRGVSVDSGCSSASMQSNAHTVCGLTQYDVVRFIQHHNHELGSSLDTPILNVARVHAPLEPSARGHMPHITIRDTALRALVLLRDSHNSALPVVDADGRLVTEFAATMLRGLTASSIGLLGKPVLAYMFGLRMPVLSPYIVHENFTLSQVMSGLLRMNCRRAWLVDREERPVAVISLTDVLNHFL
ncbi:hypothetical protein GGF49_003256 [Coemansia sp. RSA 1853]|nr:hypothetical protein GGF49_003256 [Coemansia sp. RSA 1853]